MFRIMPVRVHDCEAWRQLGINMSFVDVIEPRGSDQCTLQRGGYSGWHVDGSMEDVIEFLSTDYHSFEEWRKAEPDE